MLTLYQAEWCPFSSAVREILTELGLDFVARQVEAWPEERAGLRAVSGSDEIPTLENRKTGNSSAAPARSSPTSAASRPGSRRPSIDSASTTTCPRASRSPSLA